MLRKGYCLKQLPKKNYPRFQRCPHNHCHLLPRGVVSGTERLTGRGAAPAPQPVSDRKRTGRRPARLARRHYDRLSHVDLKGEGPSPNCSRREGRSGRIGPQGPVRLSFRSVSAGSQKTPRRVLRRAPKNGLPDRRLNKRPPPPRYGARKRKGETSWPGCRRQRGNDGGCLPRALRDHATPARCSSARRSWCRRS
jgi:hypothetical protein